MNILVLHFLLLLLSTVVDATNTADSPLSSIIAPRISPVYSSMSAFSPGIINYFTQSAFYLLLLFIFPGSFLADFKFRNLKNSNIGPLFSKHLMHIYICHYTHSSPIIEAFLLIYRSSFLPLIQSLTADIELLARWYNLLFYHRCLQTLNF